MKQFDERLDSLDLVGDELEAPQQRIERVRRCELPNSVGALVDAYEKTVGVRDRFLWKWLYFVFPAVTLSCVDSTHEERVRDQKLLASLFVVTLDDVGERDLNRKTFEELSKVPFDYQTTDPDREGVDADLVTFAETVWERLEELLDESPRASEYRPIFEFDLKQNVNAIDYSYTVNRHLEMANVCESTIYDTNNMMLFTYAGIDLMHSRSFDRSELSALRRVVTSAQRMARIGNWVTTWEREIREGDYSSGIVVYALENGIVEREELYKLSAGRFSGDADELVARIEDNGVEEIFLDRWHRNYEEAERLRNEIETVDVASFLSGMEKLLSYHFASRGLK